MTSNSKAVTKYGEQATTQAFNIEYLKSWRYLLLLAGLGSVVDR